MMQETLLRVFMVALSLIMCPRDERGLENWNDITARIQNHEENILRMEEELNQETASVRKETTFSGNKERADDIRNILQEQNHYDQPITEKDKLFDATVISQDGPDQGGRRQRFMAELDQSLSQEYNEMESGLKTSQVTGKENTNHIQSDGPLRQRDGPQGRHEKPGRDKFGSAETEGPPSQVYAALSENETGEGAVPEWENYLWYIWNTFSIISMARFFRKYHRSRQNNEKHVPALCTAADVTLPDMNSLQMLYTKCSLTGSEKMWEGEFLEGFTKDLLKAMRTVSIKDGGMVIEGFQRINRCEIIVPFAPPEPYGFQCHLCNNQTSNLLHLQSCGQIKVVEKIRNHNGCPCQSSDADDMVCLLHGDNEKAKTTVDTVNGPFCSDGTPFLSTSQIIRWFQSIVKQAWGLISHKYEFELIFRTTDTLTIRFRSGKKICFRMKPVVKNNVLFFTPLSSNDLDTFWTPSLTTYEERLLQHFSKLLPEDSCHLQVLEVALFLHKRQTAVTGGSALKSSHFKTALLHLLLNTDPAQWKPNNIASRLRDVLRVIEAGLEKKLLNHALVGNPLTAIQLPAEFIKAKPVNLFHPLVVHECMHRNAVMHFQEMLRNAHMLIEEYARTAATQVKTSELPKLQS